MSVQPGLSTSFPWLSGLARMYESYVFLSLTYDYVPACGSATPGSVSLALDFDAFDTAPQNKGELMQNQAAVRGVPWNPLRLTASRANLQKFGIQRFTRQDDLADNLDIKTYDVGGLFIATDNAVNPLSGWGDLFVSYTIDLITPQAPTWDKFEISTTIGKITSGAQPDPSHLFGTGAVQEPSTKLPLTVSDTGNALTLPRKGAYILDWRVQGQGLNGAVVPAVQLLSGLAEIATLEDLHVSDTNGEGKQLWNITKAPVTFLPTMVNRATSIANLVLRVYPWVSAAL